MNNKEKPKNHLILITILFIVFLVIIVSSESLFEAGWPYLAMIGVTLIVTILARIKVSNRTLLLIVFTFLIMLAGAKFWFYFVIPDYYDYQPVTVPGMMMIFQIHGKMQVYYSPDYPVQGDTISGYISGCANDYSRCIDLDSYKLTAYFKDEGGTKHILIDNKEFNNKTKFEVGYMGEPIYVEMEHGNVTYRPFILPKESFWQTFQTQFNRHPFWGLLNILGIIPLIISALIISRVKDLSKKIREAYINDFRKIIFYFKKK